MIDAAPPAIVNVHLPTLNENLTQLNQERQNLVNSLKSSRREAQKSEAVLRNNIDIFRRASEKSMAAESRTRQKILALQETIKRTEFLTTELETDQASIESEFKSLQIQKAQMEAEWADISQSSEAIRQKRVGMENAAKKAIDGARHEVTAQGHRLEKIKGRKEKLAGIEGNATENIPSARGLIRELEDELREIQAEIERTEVEMRAQRRRDPASESEFEWHSGRYDSTRSPSPQLASPYLPLQRHRSTTSNSSVSHTQMNGLGPIGRPNPIQRPLSLTGRTVWPVASANSSQDSPVDQGEGEITAETQPTGSGKGLSRGAPPFEPTQNLTKALLGQTAGGIRSLNR